MRRLTDFIRLAEAGRKAGRKARRPHNWPTVVSLVELFVTNNRHNNDPANLPGAQAVNREVATERS